MNSMKRQKDRTLKDELPKLVGAQYATGEEWRNSYKKNEEGEPGKKKKKVTLKDELPRSVSAQYATRDE